MLFRRVARGAIVLSSLAACSRRASGATAQDADDAPTHSVNGGDCTNDSDCTSGQNGRCGPSETEDGNCDRCSYDECFADADCLGRGLCDCRAGAITGANVCTAGNCRVDADCGSGGYCSPSTSRCPSGVETASVGYFCRTSTDTCVEDEDCTNSSQQCRYDANAAHWRCFDFPGCPT